MARRSRGCGSTCTSPTPTAPSTVVRSDDIWKVSVDGPTRYDSYYLGETYDARREIAGWDRPGFDDSALGGGAGGGGARGHAARAGARADPRRRHAAAGHAQRAVAGRLRLRHRPEPHRLGRDPRERAGGHGDRDLLLREARRRRPGQHRRQRPRLRPAADRLLRREGRGRRALGAALQLQGLPVRAAQRPARRAAAGGRQRDASSASSRCARRSRATVDASSPRARRSTASTATRPGRCRATCTASSPTRRSTRRTPGPATPQLTAGTASLLFDTERLYRKMFQDMRDAQTGGGRGVAAGAEQPELRLRRQARVQARGLLRRDAGLGRVLVRDPVGELQALRRPARARGDATRRCGSTSTSGSRAGPDKDGDAYAHTLTSGPRRLGPARGRADGQRARVDRLLRAPRADRGRRRARARARRTTPRATTRLFAAIRADFNARFLGADGVYREKDADPFVADRADPAARVRARAGRAARGGRGAAGRRHREGPRRPRVRGRDRRALRAARAHRDRPPRRRPYAVATQTTEPSWGYWTDVAGFTALGEHWPADHALAQPPLLRRDRRSGSTRTSPASGRLAPGYGDDRVQARDPGERARPRVGVLRQRARNDRRELAAHRRPGWSWT